MLDRVRSRLVQQNRLQMVEAAFQCAARLAADRQNRARYRHADANEQPVDLALPALLRPETSQRNLEPSRAPRSRRSQLECDLHRESNSCRTPDKGAKPHAQQRLASVGHVPLSGCHPTTDDRVCNLRTQLARLRLRSRPSQKPLHRRAQRPTSFQVQLASENLVLTFT